MTLPFAPYQFNQYIFHCAAGKHLTWRSFSFIHLFRINWRREKIEYDLNSHIHCKSSAHIAYKFVCIFIIRAIVLVVWQRQQIQIHCFGGGIWRCLPFCNRRQFEMNWTQLITLITCYCSISIWTGIRCRFFSFSPVFTFGCASWNDIRPIFFFAEPFSCVILFSRSGCDSGHQNWNLKSLQRHITRR